MLVARAAVAFIVAVVVGTLLTAGALSNWFRYGFSLEAAYVFVPVAIAACLSIAVSVIAFRQRRWAMLLLACCIAVCGAVVFPVAHRQAFGTAFPEVESEHTLSSGTAALHTPSGTVQYELRLQNPFARSHKEFLIVTRAGTTQTIQVPVFDGPAGGFGGALEPHDWVILTPTDDPNVLRMQVGKSLLVNKSFLIDLRISRASTTTKRTHT